LPLVAPVLLGDEGITLIITALNVITEQIVQLCGGRDGGVLELHGGSENTDISHKDKLVSHYFHL
jgi:hypothetical protein